MMMKHNDTTKVLFNKIEKRFFGCFARLHTDNLEQDLDNSSETSSSESNTNLEYKKTYYKNNLLKQTLKQNLDNNKNFTNDNILNEQDKIIKERVDISDERKQLNFDLQSIGLAIKALFKMDINKTPSKKEFNAFGHIQNSYDSFFEEDSKSTIDDLKNVRSYIKEELQANEFRLKKLHKNLNKESLINLDKRKLDEISDGEESNSSKKSRNSTSEFLDELPYNPFDDIGTD